MLDSLSDFPSAFRTGFGGVVRPFEVTIDLNIEESKIGDFSIFVIIQCIQFFLRRIFRNLLLRHRQGGWNKKLL